MKYIVLTCLILIFGCSSTTQSKEEVEDLPDSIEGKYKVFFEDEQMNETSELTWNFDGLGNAYLRGHGMGISMDSDKKYEIVGDSVHISSSMSFIIKGDSLIGLEVKCVKIN